MSFPRIRWNREKRQCVRDWVRLVEKQEERLHYFFTGFGVALTSGLATGFGAGATGFLTSTFFSIENSPFCLTIGFLKYLYFNSSIRA